MCSPIDRRHSPWHYAAALYASPQRLARPFSSGRSPGLPVSDSRVPHCCSPPNTLCRSTLHAPPTSWPAPPAPRSWRRPSRTRGRARSARASSSRTWSVRRTAASPSPSRVIRKCRPRRWLRLPHARVVALMSHQQRRRRRCHIIAPHTAAHTHTHTTAAPGGDHTQRPQPDAWRGPGLRRGCPAPLSGSLWISSAPAGASRRQMARR